MGGKNVGWTIGSKGYSLAPLALFYFCDLQNRNKGYSAIQNKERMEEIFSPLEKGTCVDDGMG